jgi:hypothetical protein
LMSGTRRPGGYPQAGPPATAGQPAVGYGSQRGRHSDEIPVVTGIPVSRDAAPPFDVFTPVSRAGDVRAGNGHGPDHNGPESGGTTSHQDAPYGNIGVSGEGYGTGGTDGGEQQGLPRRVRQASLAPQLRDSVVGGAGAGAGAGRPGPAGVAPASAASLSDMRTTLSAMQRGWQQGRSQSAQPDTEGNPNGA